MFQLYRVVLAALALCTAGVSGAFAADLPLNMPTKAVPPVAAYNWTGFYVGGHIGGGWVNESGTFLSTTGVALDPAGTVYDTDHSGFLGGAQIGYNYQIQNWVLGITGDFSWTHASADTVTNGTTGPASVIHNQAKTDWYATLAGRVGYAFNNWLLYGKGGVAWEHQVYGGFATTGAGTTVYSDLSDTRTGWTVGAGLEWGFMNNWSAFAEYDYLDFGTNNYTFTGTPAVTSNYDVKSSVSLVKVGVNYQF